jgi:hypothetical protein
MIIGHVDLVQRDRISGWAADDDYPNATVDLTVIVDGIEVGHCTADQLRRDLQQLGTYGEGRHGFLFEFAVPLSSTEDHEIQILVGTEQQEKLGRGHFKIARESDVTGDAKHPTSVIVLGESGQPRKTAAPRYVIHIGPHKTGSKYLQSGLHALRNQLMARGILYPTNWLDATNPSHAPLSRRLQSEDASLQEEFNQLNASTHKVVVISAEDLVDLERPSLEYLKTLIADHQTEIVFYLRRWSELLPSAWQETVKHGGDDSLPAFFAQHLASPLTSNLINFDIVLRNFTDVFGTASLRLVSYSNLAGERTDILEHFIQSFLAWSEPPALQLDRQNQSLGLFDAEMVRVLNAVQRAHTGQSGDSIFRHYIAMKPTLDLSHIVSAMERYVRTARIDEAAPGLRAVHELIFSRYANCLVRPKSGYNLFPPADREIRFVQDNYILMSGILDALMTIYRAVTDQDRNP